MDYFGVLQFELKKKQVWGKAATAPFLDPDIARIDRYGNLILYREYGNRNSPYGWEFDHIFPSSLGGVDTITNLQPLNCKANIQKSNKIYL